MFVRIKQKGPYRYLQIVENRRDGKVTRQRVVGALGRLDEVTSNGTVDGLVRSLAKHAQQVRVVEGHRTGQLEAGASRMLGPDLVFGPALGGRPASGRCSRTCWPAVAVGGCWGSKPEPST